MKFLIVDDLHASIFDYLKEAGIEWDYQPDILPDQVKTILPNYDGLIVRSKIFVDEDMLKGTHLKVIARAGAGVDNIDENALAKYNIQLINAPEGNCDAVAEHTIGLILALLNNFRKAGRELKSYAWIREGNRGFELSSFTVGIIGYGFMGKALCKRLVAFGCNVVVYDRKEGVVAEQEGVEMVSLEDLKRRTDILSLHIPLLKENHFLVNADFLNGFTKNIWLINTSRGKVVKTEDILPLLESGKIRGLALDVWENENPKAFSATEKVMFDGLINHNKVVMTPHVAGWTFESYQKISETMGRKIVQWVNKS